MSPIPPHCPYKAGDRVQMHGHAGYHLHHGQHLEDHAVTGFRGVVERYFGGTVLAGTTDDGRTWGEEWGALSPDGTPCHDARCDCCPHPPGNRMVNGRLRTGTCQPTQASRERAQAAARELAEWWRAGCPPRSGPAIEQLDLGFEGVAAT